MDSISMIAIIDYGMGNLRSVQKAFEQVGAAAKLFAAPTAESRDADRLVLPGVGAFGDGMANLQQRGWVEPIRQFIATGRPVLGICLGLQLLFDGSEEDAPQGGLVPGLGILRGSVRRFQPQHGQRLKVPHMGWNNLTWRRDDPLLRSLDQDVAVYFFHSYFALPSEGDMLTSATAQYPQGVSFCASVWRDNIWATQFHPEKSQRVGLKMLENFTRI